MKFLDYIQEISSSEEEFLAIIEEMNRWIGDEKNERRFIHMPHNLKRFDFSRDEYKQALNIASTGCAKCKERAGSYSSSSNGERTKRLPTQTIQSAESHPYHKQKLPKDGENQNAGNTLLFYATGSVDTSHRLS